MTGTHPNALESAHSEPWLLQGRVPRIVVFLFSIDLALVAAYLLTVAADLPVDKINRFFDLARERNLPTWYSSLQLFVLASLMAVFAYHRFDRARPRSWLLAGLALVWLGLSLDETAEIHEFLGQLTDLMLERDHRDSTPFGHTGIWMFVIGPPFLLLMSGLFAGIARDLRDTPGVMTKLVVGLLVFVAGAAGIEIAANFVVIGSVWHVVQISCEELCEMLGVTVMLWGAVDLLSANGFSVYVRPPAPDAE